MSGHIPIHGNYRGYYTKRPSVNDPRLALLPEGTFEHARVLDVGCNEGWVTCEIAQSWGAKQVIGVDIDDTLVRAAWKRRKTVWSQQKPITLSASNGYHPDGAAPHDKKRKYEDNLPTVQPHYFPASFEHTIGTLPIPPRTSLKEGHFPHNVIFRTADWVKTGILDDSEGYDIVVAFSITKWIHLNDGDSGLLSFFRRVHSVLKPEGSFILEPQEWDTYAKARRMDPVLKENAKCLEIRPEHFQRVLLEIGFSSAQHFGTTGKGGFRRPIDLFRKLAV